MTVIATCYATGHGTLCGDTLLWRENNNATNGLLYLPFTGERQFKPKSARHKVVSGMLQKVVMFGDEAAIAWAGRRDVAQKIFSRLRRDQIGPNDIEEQLNEHFGALPFYKQEQTSFQGIICNNGWSKKDKNTILFSTRHDCVVADEDRLAFASGSGAQKFCTKLQHYWKNDPDEIGSETLPALENNVAMLFAAFICSVDEFYQGVDQEDTFGGAFEVAFSQRTTDN